MASRPTEPPRHPGATPCMPDDRILTLTLNPTVDIAADAESVRQFGVEVHRGSVESTERSHDAGVGMRVVQDGKIGFSYTSDITRRGLERAFDEARVNASATSPVDVDCLADNEEWIAREDLYPTVPPEDGDHNKIEYVRAMESACYSFDPAIANTESALYHEMCGDIFVASTRGFLRHESRGFCSCFIAAVARRGEEVRSGSCFAQALHRWRLSPTGTEGSSG